MGQGLDRSRNLHCRVKIDPPSVVKINPPSVVKINPSTVMKWNLDTNLYFLPHRWGSRHYRSYVITLSLTSRLFSFFLFPIIYKVSLSICFAASIGTVKSGRHSIAYLMRTVFWTQLILYRGSQTNFQSPKDYKEYTKKFRERHNFELKINA